MKRTVVWWSVDGSQRWAAAAFWVVMKLGAVEERKRPEMEVGWMRRGKAGASGVMGALRSLGFGEREQKFTWRNAL